MLTFKSTSYLLHWHVVEYIALSHMDIEAIMVVGLSEKVSCTSGSDPIFFLYPIITLYGPGLSFQFSCCFVMFNEVCVHSLYTMANQ